MSDVANDVIKNKYEVLLLDNEGFTQPQTSDFYQELLRLKSMEKMINNYIDACKNKGTLDNKEVVWEASECDECHFTDFCPWVNRHE